MANVNVEIASRSYSVACRDGEEAHLEALASAVDGKAREAAAALGNMGEVRQLLLASLLLADELKETRAGTPTAAAPQPDPKIANALERLADRIEILAERLESRSLNT